MNVIVERSPKLSRRAKNRVGGILKIARRLIRAKAGLTWAAANLAHGMAACSPDAKSSCKESHD